MVSLFTFSLQPETYSGQIIGLLVYSLFGIKSATKVILAGLKQYFYFSMQGSPAECYCVTITINIVMPFTLLMVMYIFEHNINLSNQNDVREYISVTTVYMCCTRVNVQHK